MSGADSPEILAAYDAVRSDKDETTWLLDLLRRRDWEQARADQDRQGRTSRSWQAKLDNGQVQYAYARVEYANDAESKRVKFVLVIWIGENTRVMRKRA